MSGQIREWAALYLRHPDWPYRKALLIQHVMAVFLLAFGSSQIVEAILPGDLGQVAWELLGLPAVALALVYGWHLFRGNVRQLEPEWLRTSTEAAEPARLSPFWRSIELVDERMPLLVAAVAGTAICILALRGFQFGR